MTPSEMARLRWQGIPLDERQRIMAKLTRKRNRKLLAAERREIARNAVRIRWKRHRERSAADLAGIPHEPATGPPASPGDV